MLLQAGARLVGRTLRAAWRGAAGKWEEFRARRAKARGPETPRRIQPPLASAPPAPRVSSGEVEEALLSRLASSAKGTQERVDKAEEDAEVD